MQLLTLCWLLQIQRLLEAQARQAGSSEAAAARQAVQAEKPGDLVSMETQTSPPHSPWHKRRSVSVAVSTGNASFFPNKPALLILDLSVLGLGTEEMFCRNPEAVQTRT